MRSSISLRFILYSSRIIRSTRQGLRFEIHLSAVYHSSQLNAKNQRVQTAAPEAALAGADIAEIKTFQNQHLDTSSAVDEFVHHDLFHPAADKDGIELPCL
jgi:hypothetical protein